MSIKKQFLKNKPVCKVTFKAPKTLVDSASEVSLVGDFNDWNPAQTPMKGLKNGAYTTTLTLESGREYQFRYLVDGKIWKNEEEADKLTSTEFHDAQNSVLVL